MYTEDDIEYDGVLALETFLGEVAFCEVEVARKVPEAAKADLETLKRVGVLVDDVGPSKDLSALPMAVVAPFRHVPLRASPPPAVMLPRVSTMKCTSSV